MIAPLPHRFRRGREQCLSVSHYCSAAPPRGRSSPAQRLRLGAGHWNWSNQRNRYIWVASTGAALRTVRLSGRARRPGIPPPTRTGGYVIRSPRRTPTDVCLSRRDRDCIPDSAIGTGWRRRCQPRRRAPRQSQPALSRHPACAGYRFTASILYRSINFRRKS